MIVGLGNPGPRYRANRHNIGFQCVDLFAHRHRMDAGKVQMKAAVTDGWISCGMERKKVILVKPQTYMNASGEAVGPLVRYFDIDLEDLIVVHDDLDLEHGKMRLRHNGSSGGQNGIRSILRHLNGPDFDRVKVGIGRPPGRMAASTYVLQDFTRAENEEIFAPLRETVCDALECWLFEGIDRAMNRYNG